MQYRLSFPRLIRLVSWFMVAALSIAAHAQTPGQQQCGQYVEAYRQGADGYAPYMGYVQGALDARSAPESLRKSAPASLALWLNNWCSANPLRPFADATGAMIEQSGALPVGRAAQPAVVIVAPAVAPSCKAGATQYCNGCSVTCAPGEKPFCHAGVDSMGGNGCINLPHCGCTKP